MMGNLVIAVLFLISISTHASDLMAIKADLPANKAPNQDDSKTDSKIEDPKVLTELKKQCDTHFPSQLQGTLRPACLVGGKSQLATGKSMSQVICRLDFGADPREVMACFIGVAISEDMEHGREDFKRKLRVCSDYYPPHTDLDFYLVESCLTGIHLPQVTGRDVSGVLCNQISNERSYLGPCNVGLSLLTEAQTADTTENIRQQNKLCEQYFDHRQFHLGYRTCLNGRALSLTWNGQQKDILKACQGIISDKGNENERAACVVGVSIYQSIIKTQKPNPRFQACGENSKVSYQERDFLACLTAASLVDLGEKKTAFAGCKEIFNQRKSKSRDNCTRALDLF